ncbi:MAG: ATP-dependent protease ATPase subunit HslU [Clostridiales bacterium]|nr:ATP-dependent protease ATPase subunit HslU [Clostridiales bacterium]MDD7688856.1 ATP-dependent protease ATPase subunit HslU [Clostridiales bacterium]
MIMLTPKQTVEALNKYIVGQDEAKKTVAIALRNRYRRSRLPEEIREEIVPKNIIMIGPTGVGKTEIARRLAKLVDAPFVKVEATKFTEVGYVGRDVDSMIRDIVEVSIRLVKKKWEAKVKVAAEAAAEQRIVELLLKDKKDKKPKSDGNGIEMLQKLFGNFEQNDKTDVVSAEDASAAEEKRSKRAKLLDELRSGMHENDIIEVDVAETNQGSDSMLAMGIDINLGEMFGGMLPRKTKKRKVTVSEGRRILVAEESDKLIDMDEVIREAIDKAEQSGIVFIDEIDKIASNGGHNGPDVSREGVQRDILPIVEGCTVSTKYGPVRTNYMLFIAAGAFHVSKVDDLIPELQGRFPIRVELNPLTLEDYERILTKPENAILKQYTAMLETDNLHLIFEDEALHAIAQYAYYANENSENIGARRLHTIVENLLEDISFNATGDHPMIDVVIDEKYVKDHLKQKGDKNVERYII